MKKSEFRSLLAKANAAGKVAAEAHAPTPMIVSGGYAPVMGGVCGFAWINIKPGNSALANYAKKNYGARKDYYGGVSIWVGDYGQSMEKKEAYARAFAATVREAGFERVFAMSRMD